MLNVARIDRQSGTVYNIEVCTENWLQNMAKEEDKYLFVAFDESSHARIGLKYLDGFFEQPLPLMTPDIYESREAWNPVDGWVDPQPLTVNNDCDVEIPILPNSLYLDIGFGDGSFTLGLARQDCSSSFLAVDVRNVGVDGFVSNLKREGISNVEIIVGDVAVVLRESVDPSSLAGVYLMFPETWETRHENWIVTQELLDLVYQGLSIDGFWYISTESNDYATFISKLFMQEDNALMWDGGYCSRFRRDSPYEICAVSEGRKVSNFCFTKKQDYLMTYDPTLDEFVSPVVEP